jgi:hypothetical protein
MAKDRNHLPGFETENTGGLLAGFLAEEEEVDRRSLWRLGSWGVAALGSVIVAMLANQSTIGLRRDQVASADLARQSQQIQLVANESQKEARRLTSAIDTLNGDRDRLYSRVTVLEQGLDSVTGAVSRQSPASASPPAVATAPAMSSPAMSSPPMSSPPMSSSAMASPAAPSSAAVEPAPTPSPPPVTSPVATAPAKTTEKPAMGVSAAEPAPATASSVGHGAPASPPSSPPTSQAASHSPSQAASLMAPKSMMAPPDAAAAKLVEPEKPASVIVAAPMPEVVASAAPADSAADPDASSALPKVAVQRTEFGVDVGSANSLGGLRALWRGLLKSRANAPLASLQPIIVIKENSTGLGMQLRLVAGPLGDAAAAAKICAGLVENNRVCETAVFDGQRLTMKAEEPPASAKSAAENPIKSTVRRRGATRRVPTVEPPKEPEPTTLSSFFGRSRAAQ